VLLGEASVECLGAHDLSTGTQITWIAGAVWPPVGTVIELAQPNRAAIVIGIRLAVLHDHTANVIVDVSDAPEHAFIPRHPADRLSGD
jgi:hypothetical protein